MDEEERALIKELIGVTGRGSTDIRAAVRALERERANTAALTARIAVLESQRDTDAARIAALEAHRGASHRFLDLASKSTHIQAAIAAVLIVAALAFGLRLAPDLPTVLSVWRPLVP